MAMRECAPRSMDLFEESIKSRYTRELYTTHLRQFMEFAGAESAQQISEMPVERLQAMLEDYLFELKRTINPNSVPIRFTGLRHFCIMNRKEVNWDIIRKLFPERQRKTGRKPWTTADIGSMLGQAGTVRTRAVIHFFASTGARVGVFDHDLLFGHTRPMDGGCVAVRLYAGHVEEYWSFLTPQAAAALGEYRRYREARGESITPGSPLFASYDLRGQMTVSGVKNVMSGVIGRAATGRCAQGKRYDIQMHHGFRKRFNTILKLNSAINDNIAEKLMGHRNGLDGVYFVPTLEELHAEFVKAVPDLAV